MRLFISPHNDDAALFGAFTIQRERPTVLTVFDSYLQQARGFPSCRWDARAQEDMAAMQILGADLVFGRVRDDEPEISISAALRALFARFGRAREVWLPQIEPQGHWQHNLVARIGAECFAQAQIHRYLTYTEAGKSSAGIEIPCTGLMLRKKLEALACYRSQIEIDELGSKEHFLRDQREYLAVAP